MWNKTENSDTTKPLVIDRESSPSTVYFRRNFEFIAETEKRPAHWTYEEMAVPQDFYDTYINIDDINNALVELAEIISEVING